ncbi:MAG: hypothetical protein M1834_003461 [Cirrosporium novae-zelandiae]|nr:MAG: hypothetical protein M1834_003461 [Cirrosporium novae-zelandiae]
MEVENTLSLLDQLDDDIDNLEDSLKPMLQNALTDLSSKLPLLDKAKLFVTMTYTIESILFSFIRLQGVNAKEHPIFRELTRVKQYFEKIKAAEHGNGDTKRETLSVNKEAAKRIINHAISDNKRIDFQRLEQQAKEKKQAQQKFQQLSKKHKRENKDDSSNENSSDSTSANSGSEAPGILSHHLPENSLESRLGTSAYGSRGVHKKKRRMSSKNKKQPEEDSSEQSSKQTKRRKREMK